MSSKKLEVLCPCCETKLQVDRKTGEVLWQEKKPKPDVSLSDMARKLEEQRKEQATQFKKFSETQKERGRLLDEKFKEAQKNVDRSTDKPLRDFDLD